jgi:hypothetical protein
MKRSTAYPERRSHGEFRLNCEKSYNQIVRDAEKQPRKINPVFTERPHYGIPEPVKEEAYAERK